jgi:hypothetical protein
MSGINQQTLSFALAVLLGAASCAIGFALYRYGSAYVKYKSARFGGAVAIAGVAFYLMAGFYFRQLESAERARENLLAALREALTEYDTCIAHEKQISATEFACKRQADALRDAAKPLLR